MLYSVRGRHRGSPPLHGRCPGFVRRPRRIVGNISAFLSTSLGPLNPISDPMAVVREHVTDLIKEEIGEAFGIDIDHLKSFLLPPTHWLNVQSVTS